MHEQTIQCTLSFPVKKVVPPENCALWMYKLKNRGLLKVLCRKIMVAISKYNIWYTTSNKFTSHSQYFFKIQNTYFEACDWVTSPPSWAAADISTTSKDFCLLSSSDTAFTSDTMGRISRTCSWTICCSTIKKSDIILQ